ncbi:hypothetical protein LRH25_18035 [Ideonella azotifigens]|uniref:Uncharacterized protein n=1 Tax=Ideonella azotifigens TaxID=513160 RepID=A0ABP3VJB2_9BURK|nr:hypothetical protein [Ideonella azotifigens]MCD2342240.1 hypothetical protein [Ideonella azotifigens]
MNPLVFEETGSLGDPALHDACIYRIDFGDKQVTFFCRAPDGQSTRLELRGVEHMLSNGLAEQNVLLDVCVEDDSDVCVQVLSRVLPGAGVSQQAYRDLVLQRLQQKQLMLLRFSPSYGGEILVLCKEALYESES